MVLDLGRRRAPAHPGLHRLRHARAPARADLPGLPEPRLGADRRSPAGARSSASPSTTTSGCPSFDPPYVIAIVALAEDPGVRLTTNIVGCDPERRAHRPGGRGPLRAARGRVAPAVRTDGRDRLRPIPSPEPERPVPRPPARRRAVRAPRRALRHRPVGARPAADGRPAVAHGRRLPRRRSPTPG